MARSFTVVTGHLAKDDAQNINWKDYAKVDTLVILMGVRRRSEISKELIESGRNPKELVAFVENGTTPFKMLWSPHWRKSPEEKSKSVHQLL